MRALTADELFCVSGAAGETWHDITVSIDFGVVSVSGTVDACWDAMLAVYNGVQEFTDWWGSNYDWVMAYVRNTTGCFSC
jgi:hypothetical protein